MIDIDNDDDSEDVMIIGEKVSSNKGKTIDAVHGDLQVVVCIRFILFLASDGCIFNNLKTTLTFYLKPFSEYV